MTDVLAEWNGDFELGSPPPLDKPNLVGHALIKRTFPYGPNAPVAHGGEYFTEFQFEREAVNHIPPIVRFNNVPVTPSVEYTFSFWFHPAWTTGVNVEGEWHTWDLIVLVRNLAGDLTEVFRLDKADMVDGWTQYTASGFVPTGATVDIFVQGDRDTADSEPWHTYWGYLDDCQFLHPMFRRQRLARLTGPGRAEVHEHGEEHDRGCGYN
jgi:hypothetical protein